MDPEPKRPRRVSRRQLLWFAGGAAGTAGLSAIGCSGGKKAPASPTAFTGVSETPGSSPSSKPTPGDSQHGETLRYTGYVVSDKVYDPHKTQAGPFYGQEAMVLSRLLVYRSQTEGGLLADLATGAPEQPDPQTLIFKLNGAARWQDREPLNGRNVTADDVKFSIERQMQGDVSFIRRAQWANIDKIESTSPSSITFTLKTPLAAMVERFADVNAFIVAPELVSNGHDFDAQTQVGSGPFQWAEWSEGQFASVSRNPHWHGGNTRPYLDGVTIFQPKDTSEVEAGLRTKKRDVAFVGRPQAEKLKGVIPELQESTVGHSLFFGMRFNIAATPFNDPRFRAALSVAIDRRDMIQQFFAGSGGVNPWISWPMKRWTLPETELTAAPGYRPGAGGREADIKDARDLFAAYGSEKVIPNPLNLYVLDDAESNLKMGSVMRAQFKQVLDLNVDVYPVAIGPLTTGMLDGSYSWVAGPDIGWIDLDDWVYPYFHSAGTKNTFPLRDADLDKLIESQRTELDENKRRQIGYEIQRRLLVINAGVNFVSETVVALRWPYVRDFPLDAADGYQHRFADTWINRADPTFHGR